MNVEWRELASLCGELGAGAYLATTRSDGHPHVSWVGIGFDVEVERLWTATYRSSQKARNLRHDHRVALHWPERPDRLVFMRALARLVDDAEEQRELWERQVLPYDQAQFFGNGDNPELLFVEITPVVASVHDGDPAHRPRRYVPA